MFMIFLKVLFIRLFLTKATVYMMAASVYKQNSWYATMITYGLKEATLLHKTDIPFF